MKINLKLRNNFSPFMITKALLTIPEKSMPASHVERASLVLDPS
jgi:hypothetical protein